MPVIHIAQNRVVADEPATDDTHVQVVWFGPSQDGRHRAVFHGPVQLAEDYEAAVAWAVEMAGQMVHPLYVVPLSGVDVLRTDQMRDAVTNLTDRQRGELRRDVISTLAQVLRDSDDPEVRSDAYCVLVDMGVVR